MASFAFRIFGAAMLAEPAVAEVKKVIGLIQGNERSRRESFGAGLTLQTGTCQHYCLRIPRLTSGP